jgi:hypothetical protein
MWRDGTAKLLYRLDSAGYGWGKTGGENWGVVPFTNLRKDGRLICFTSTSGTYSEDDFHAQGVKPYRDVGVFLAELDLVKNQQDPNDDTLPPTMPGNLKATSAGGTVTLTWDSAVDPANETTPSTGIAGYNIFRDDVKIDVVPGGGTQYVDSFNVKSGTSYRYFISAYDHMALESPRTAEVSLALK